MIRIYKIHSPCGDIEIDSESIFDLDNNYENINKHLIKKYKVKKRRYQSIFQETIIENNNENKQTYVEEFELIKKEKEYITFKYNRINLDEREFPPLYKYDFDEIYEEEIYSIIYKHKKCKLILNPFENYMIY